MHSACFEELSNKKFAPVIADAFKIFATEMVLTGKLLS